MASTTAPTSPCLDLGVSSTKETASTASCQVLSTPELLEQILLCLPRLDILLLRSTNSTFRDIVDSPVLREHSLFGHAKGARGDQQLAAFHTAHTQQANVRADKHDEDPDLTHIKLEWAPLLAQCPFSRLKFHDGALYCLRSHKAEDDYGLDRYHVDYSLWYRISGGPVEAHLQLPDVADFPSAKVPKIWLRRVGDPEMGKKRLWSCLQENWVRLKLLGVAVPVTVIISYASRGLLFAPQRNPLDRWDLVDGQVPRLLGAEEADLGALLSFWDQVADEYGRVNSGEYSKRRRAALIAKTNAALDATVGAGNS